MADYQSIFDSVLGTPSVPAIKAQSVLDAAISKQAAINGQSLFDTGTVVEPDPTDPNTPRNTAQIVGDTLNSILTAPVSLAGGLTALAAGTVDPETGLAIARGTNKVVEVAQRLNSNQLKAARQDYAQKQARSEQTNQNIRDREVKTDGSLIAGFKKVGRDTVDAFTNSLSNDAMVGDVVSSAIGSLLSAGPVAKGLKGVGAAVLEQGVKRGVIAEGGALATKAASVGNKAAIPAAVGLQEGAGAYQQTVTDAYNQAIQSGYSHEEAVIMANRAGVMAAAIQAPIATGIGLLPGMSKLEESPFGVPSLGSATRKVLGETAEEGVQSATGQLAQNVGIRTFANPNQDLTTDVGEQVALGAIGGAGSAAVVQTPGLALQTAAKVAGLPGDAARWAVGKAVDRGNRIISNLKAASPFSAEKMTQAWNAAATFAGDRLSRDEIKAAVDQVEPNQEAKQQTFDYIDQLFDKAQFDPAEADQTFPVIGDAIRGSSDRFDAIRRVADIATNKDAAPADKLAAGLYLLDNIKQYQGLLLQDLPEAISQVPDDHPSLDQLRQFENVVLHLQDHPDVHAALKSAQEAADHFSQQGLPEQIDTPEGQQAVSNAIGVAQFMPDKLSPQISQKILDYVASKKLELTQDQLGAVKASQALTQGNEDYKAQLAALNLKPSEIVSRQILTDQQNKDSLEKSATEHFKGVLEAVHAGATGLVGERLQDFGKFVQHMQNKIGAFNQSYANGDSKPVPFQALAADSRKFFKSSGVYLNPRSKASIQLAQQTQVEAEALTKMYNHLVDALPGVGAKKLGLTPLVPDLMEPADEIVKRTVHQAEEIKSQSKDKAPENKASEAKKPKPAEADQESSAAAREAETVNEAKPVSEPQAKATGEAEAKVSDESAADKQADAPNIRGEKIDKEWTAFTPESGTLGIPRDQMPQIPGNSRGALIQFLDSRGISYTEDTVPADSLKPTQAEFSEAKVADQKTRSGGGRSILISKDGYILDGHHQWMAERDLGNDVKVIRFDAPIEDLIQVVREMPSVTTTGDDIPFSNLATTKFRDSFKLPKEPSSRLLESDQPIADIKAALKSGQSFNAMSGNQLGARLTKSVVAAYSNYLEGAADIYREMNKRLAEFVNDPKVAKAIADKVDVESWVRGKALNVTEAIGDKIVYDPKLLQGSILAGLQWVLTRSEGTREYDEEDVARFAGVDLNDPNLDQIVQIYNDGVSLQDAKRSLADMITSYWGVQARSDAPLGYTKGIPEAMAAEVLYGLQAAGLIELDSVNYEVDGSPRTAQRVRRTKDLANGDMLRTLSAFPGAIDNLVLKDPAPVHFIGEPPAKVAEFQMHNRLVKNSTQQIEALKNQQQTPFHFNMTMKDFVLGLGERMVLELFGEGDLDARDDLNVNYRKSLEGKNRTWSGAFSAIEDLYAEASSIAGDKVAETPIYYEFNVSRVGRMHMLGRHNPQASKLTREVVLPSRSTLDLTDQAQRDAFMLAIAQHLGIKVHKQPLAKSVSDVQAMLDGELAPAVELLDKWMESQGTRKPYALTLQDIETLKDGLGTPTPAAIHSLIEYARYQQARAAKTEHQFDTQLYLEADGVTDGPINSLVHMTSGEFTPAWVAKVGKGGLYFGSQRMSINDFVGLGAENAVDLYETASRALKQILVDLRNEIQDPAAYAQMIALQRVMVEFLPDMSLSESGELEIKRGIAKNPLTVTIYGSGVKGIASKIAGALIDEYYKGQPNGFDPEVSKALNELFFKVVRKSKGEYSLWDLGRNTAGPRSPDTPAETLSPAMIKNLQENVLSLFARPLVEAVNYTIGETKPGMDAIQKATQIQSIFLKHKFRELVQAKLAEVKAKGRKETEFLTQQELDEIYRHPEMKALNPFIDTGTQTFFMAGSENADVGLETKTGEKRNAKFSRSLTDDLETPAYFHGPDNSGVRGKPTMIIGAGDGQMMQNVFTMNGRPTGGMQVFDGFNMKLSTILEDSEKVNEAVHKAWLRTPFRSVFETFQDFAAKDLKITSEAMRQELAQAILGREGVDASEAELLAEIKRQVSDMTLINRSIQARRNVLARVNMSVDHMASAESPYIQNGGIEVSGTPEEQAAQLNKLFQEELAKLDSVPAQPSKLVALVTPEGTKALEDILPSLGSSHETGVTLIKIGNMRNKIRQLSGSLNALELETARRALNSKQVAGYGIVYGTRDQTDAWLKSVNLDPSIVGINGQDYHGVTLYDEKLIILNSATPETLLHELIHAASMEKVVGYYTDPMALTPEEAEAVHKLEGLMDEFLEAIDNPEDMEFDQIVEAQTFTDQIQKTLGDVTFPPDVRKALALNEFMSWVLSNQELAQKAQQTKIKNPLLRIVSDALKALKQLLFGKKKVPELGKPGDDIYSNVRFNTAVLMKGRPSLKMDLYSLASFQAKGFGTNDRLTQLRQKFQEKIVWNLKDQPSPEDTARAKGRKETAAAKAALVAGAFDRRGFAMDMQQKSTFQALAHAFMTEIEINPNALVRLQKLYSHVTSQLTVESFMADPESQDPNDRYQAQRKFNSVMGVDTAIRDEYGRTTLLASFLALSQVDDGFREVLSKIDAPKIELKAGKNLDEVLSNYANGSMEYLSRILSGDKKNPQNVQDSIDALTDHMAKNAIDQQYYIDQFVAPVGNAIDKANDWTVKSMDTLSDRAHESLTDMYHRTESKVVRGVLKAGQILAAIVNETHADSVASGTISMINKGKWPQAIHDLINEVIGRTSENMGVYDLIKLFKASSQQIRQHFREDLPKIIAGKFSRKLTDEEWTHLHDALAKTDLAALRSGRSVAEVMSLVQDQSRMADEIQKLEDGLLPEHLVKAKELAEYMITGKVSGNLLRNAEAVAHLLGEVRFGSVKVTPELIEQIDKLVTLYAFDRLPAGTKESIANLARDEEAGTSFVYAYLEGQRKDELAKAQTSDRSRLNHYKGHVTSENAGGTSLVVAFDDRGESDKADGFMLKQRGFVRIADYKGSSLDPESGKMGYYFAPVSGKAMFNQGILQNVRHTAYGVDPVSGFTLGSMTAGRIADRETVQRITRQMARNKNATEPLMPIYDGDGTVVAYERSVDPAQEALLKRNTHIGEVLGIWRGRQVEEVKADLLNRQAISELHKVWSSSDAGRKDEFVDLFSREAQRDPVTRDAISLLTPSTVQFIKETFGNDGFMVRKDMINDTIGYRSPSVSDVWTGNTRMDPKIRDTIRAAVTGVFGIDAYRYLVQAEKVYQSFIADAKMTIVVKSVVVPVANLVSNVYQLASRGVPLKTILTSLPKKTVEIDAFLKGRLRKIALEAELRAARDDLVKARKIRTEIHSIDDAAKRLSIWPLIERGELNSISDAAISHEETLLSEGRLGAYFEKLVDKLPPSFKTAGRYAILSRDTALYQGLHRAVEYGDFLAKAILFDDLVKRQKLDKDFAFGRISEEFVNYDRLPGRTRTYLDSMGLTWFWHFKLRSMKIALSTVRNNPLHLLLAGLAPTPDFIGSVGLPMQDNMAAKVLEGNLGYSIGIGQGLRAYSLNPWANLFGL